MLVVDDDELDVLASGSKTPANYFVYLNKEGAEGRLSKEAAKLPMILASQEAEGKDGNSLLVCGMAPIYRQDDHFLNWIKERL